MRFLLINPFCPVSETPSPPLGLAFLAGALEAAGVEVRILDFAVFPYSKKMVEETLEEFSPHMVGATAVTMTFNQAVQVLEDVKSLDPQIPTVMGGPHVTFCARETMESHPCVDIIALGEGEKTIVDLAGEADRERRWNRVQGVVFRNRSGIQSTGVKETLLDINSLPLPARHLLPLARYRSLRMPLTMTTSRGCPFKCIFCVGRSMVGARVRYRNSQDVVTELEMLSRLGFHQINIADDLFTANKAHCLAICDEILKRGLKTKWTSFSRVDTVSREVLSKMKEAGCYMMSFGVESANPGILRTIRKGILLEQVLEAVTLCREAEIIPHFSFILGLPGETPQTLDETISFGQRLKDMGALHGFHLLAPFPGTEVRTKSDELGIRILTSDWNQYHANRAITETPEVGREVLDDIVIRWEKEFVDYLDYIKDLMKNGQATEEEAQIVTNLEKTVLIYDLMMGRVLEERGTWIQAGYPTSDQDFLGVLVDRVAGSVKNPKDQIYTTLKEAAEKGNLRCVNQEGRVRWEWVDFL